MTRRVINPSETPLNTICMALGARDLRGEAQRKSSPRGPSSIGSHGESHSLGDGSTGSLSVLLIDATLRESLSAHLGRFGCLCRSPRTTAHGRVQIDGALTVLICQKPDGRGKAPYESAIVDDGEHRAVVG